MDRATFEITTTNGHKAILKTYITGLEKRELSEVYIKAGETKGEVVEGAKRPYLLAEEKSIELVVIEIDGKREGLVDVFLNLPIKDCEDIGGQVKDIVEGKKTLL